MSDRLRAFIRDGSASPRDAAVRALAKAGVDVVPLLGQSDAYLVAYAEARIDHLRLDDWNPDQPRDEDGKFASTGGGTMAGAIKSGHAAIAKATSEHDLMKIGESLSLSHSLDHPTKSKLFDELATQASKHGYTHLEEMFDKKATAHIGAHYKEEKAAGEAAAQESKDYDTGKGTGKTPAHVAHAKAAREHAKEAVGHVKKIREAYKKEALNEELGAKLKAAENAAKAARSSARKAEAATTEAEAAKHAAKAKEHAAKARAHAESLDEGAPTKSTPKPKPSSAKPLGDGSLASKEVMHKFGKLQEGASKEPPSSWSTEKHAAMADAKKALAEHPVHEGMTADEMKSAADAFDAVAKKAQAAGSYWGHDYSSMASSLREAAKPKVEETSSGVDTSVPEKSARPIDSIKGDVVDLATFKARRQKFEAKLNAGEKAAALKYSGPAYTTINGDLRKGKPPDKTVHNLDSAIAKSPAPEDMVVHRGMSGDFVHHLFSEMNPGDQFVEKGYTSTSAGGKAAFGGNVKLVITIPKGYPVAPIPSKNSHENEFLIRRNTKYHVTKIEKGKTIVAHVTVVHDAK